LTGTETGLLLALAGGALSFLSPCVLPLVPPYLAYLAATEVNRLHAPDTSRQRRRVLAIALAFVLGLATVFVALGVSASAFGGWLAQHRILLGQISGAVIILFGIHFLGLYRLPMLNREARFSAPRGVGGVAGGYAMGLAFAFGWTPCIGPILASILFVAAQRETLDEATLLLGAYAAGLGIPFLLAAAFVSRFQAFQARLRPYLGRIEAAMGLFLIGVGIAFLTGAFTDASFWLLETVPVLGRIG